jgi:hypothetical protein
MDLDITPGLPCRANPSQASQTVFRLIFPLN